MSWQATLINALLRARIRRGWGGALLGDAGAVAIRRMFAQPRWLRESHRRHAHIEKATGSPVGGEWVRPLGGARPGRTILYLHGGGYVFCSEETHRALTVALATLCEAQVYAPAYRLAPEHRFPAAVDDARTAMAWLEAEGVDPGQVVVAGDSAGGGLALALLLARRDAGATPLAGAYLLSPWTDLLGTGASMRTNAASDAMFVAERVPNFARLYLGDASAAHPLASPLYADLAGLPPLLLQASEAEILLDDARRLADKARTAGVEVTMTTWRGVPHVWQLWTPYLPEAVDALAQAAAWIRLRLGAHAHAPAGR